MPNANTVFPLKQETGAIIGLAMEVHNILGPGFLEAVYKEAIEYELFQHGIHYVKEKGFSIQYKDTTLKKMYYADLVVFNSIIIEIKAKSELSNTDIAQTLNYLKCSGCKIGLILNFGNEKLGMKRLVF